MYSRQKRCARNLVNPNSRSSFYMKGMRTSCASRVFIQRVYFLLPSQVLRPYYTALFTPPPQSNHPTTATTTSPASASSSSSPGHLSIAFNFTAAASSSGGGGGGRLSPAAAAAAASCLENQFWDFLREECYNVTCGFLYANVGGHCVYRNITQSQFSNVIDRDCYMITLHPWELKKVPPSGCWRNNELDTTADLLLLAFF